MFYFASIIRCFKDAKLKMTITTNDNSELICKLQNLKNSDKYINFKKSFTRTSSIIRDKLNISYNHTIEDENVDFMIANFTSICTSIGQLIENLNKFENVNIDFINKNKAVTQSFKDLLTKEDYEIVFDEASLKTFYQSNDSPNHSSIGNHHDQTLAIRKSIILGKETDQNLSLEKDFKINLYIENSHESAVKEFHKVFKYFQSSVYSPLVELNDNVIKKFKLAIKHREFLIMDYNRYKDKFNHMESKELETDLNLLQERNYKYFMRRLDDAALEYNLATETIRNDISHFLNYLFPQFRKIWFEKYYYTVFSLSYVLYENIANSPEINKFSSQLCKYASSYKENESKAINLKLVEEYKASMRLFQRITKKKSTINYLIG